MSATRSGPGSGDATSVVIISARDQIRPDAPISTKSSCSNASSALGSPRTSGRSKLQLEVRRIVERPRLVRDGPVTRKDLQQEPVCPRTVSSALIAAHQSDGSEPDRRVAANRRVVVSGRIDDQPMMASLVEQVVDDRSDRIGAIAATLDGGIEVDVQRGVTVVRVLLLAELDETDDRAIGLDRELYQLVVLEVFGELCLQVVASPPAPDSFGTANRHERRAVFGHRRPESHSFTGKVNALGHRHMFARLALIGSSFAAARNLRLPSDHQPSGTGIPGSGSGWPGAPTVLGGSSTASLPAVPGLALR